MTAALFSPITIRGVTFPNRIGVSPMCMYSAGSDGVAALWHTVHLGSRAVGGAGMVFTEASSVTPEAGSPTAISACGMTSSVTPWRP